MMTIPLRAVPSQVVSVQLAEQLAKVFVYQKRTGLYVDLQLAGTPVVTGVIAQNGNRLVRDAYLGFLGDLAFYDTQGDSDPVYTGLTDRWFLAYLEVADLT